MLTYQILDINTLFWIMFIQFILVLLLIYKVFSKNKPKPEVFLDVATNDSIMYEELLMHILSNVDFIQELNYNYKKKEYRIIMMDKDNENKEIKN